MPRMTMAGTRIRERRIQSGIRQTELALRAEISPSYLNLIEHNRRRIGGKTLLKLAAALEVEPGYLSDGAESALLAALREAAGQPENSTVELDRVEEFAGRFPGWAQLLSDIKQKCETLEDTVEALADRLAHDPNLAASLHEVISAVTAIHSASSILTETKNLEPEWQSRFHRNINEESARLAQSAESLVRYLESAPDTGMTVTSPMEELHGFLAVHGFHFPELERTPQAVRKIVQRAPELTSDAARSMATDVLNLYAADAARLPLESVIEEIEKSGLSPDKLADRFGAGLANVFRRVALLPEDVVGPIGLIVCDGSGAMIFRKPIMGFAIPGNAGACPLWPLFQTLTQSRAPLRAKLEQAGRDAVKVRAMAVAEETRPATFDAPAVLRPHMLLLPDDGAWPDAQTTRVGVNCRICPIADCAARREPSVLSEVF